MEKDTDRKDTLEVGFERMADDLENNTGIPSNSRDGGCQDVDRRTLGAY